MGAIISAFASQAAQAIFGQILVHNATGKTMPDDPGKSLLQSRTTGGLAIIGASVLSAKLGWGIGEGEWAALLGALETAGESLAAVYGVYLALKGRVKAKHKVGAG